MKSHTNPMLYVSLAIALITLGGVAAMVATSSPAESTEQDLAVIMSTHGDEWAMETGLPDLEACRDVLERMPLNNPEQELFFYCAWEPIED